MLNNATAIANPVLSPELPALLADALRDLQSDATIQFRDSRPVSLSHAAEPVWARYREVAQPISLPGTAEVRFTLPAAALSRWCELPARAGRSFFGSMGYVAHAVQASLRAWLPYLHFDSLEKYAELDTALPLLVYAQTRPFHECYSSTLCYDVSKPGVIARLCKAAKCGLARRNASVYNAFHAVQDRGNARIYCPRNADDFLAASESRKHRIKHYFLAEEHIVEAFVTFALTLSSLQMDPPANPERTAEKALTTLSKSLQRKLRTILPGTDASALAMMLFLEATQALAVAKEDLADSLPMAA